MLNALDGERCDCSVRGLTEIKLLEWCALPQRPCSGGVLVLIDSWKTRFVRGQLRLEELPWNDVEFVGFVLGKIVITEHISPP